MYTAAVLNPSEYHDIYEEVALTGSWDQATRTKAQGLLTSLTSSHHRIHHHQECFGECQAHGIQASKEGLRHNISSVQYDRPNQGTNDNDETGDRRGVQCMV